MQKICLLWGKLIPTKMLLQRDLCEIWDVMGPEKLFWACGCERYVMWRIPQFVEAKREFSPTWHWTLGVQDVSSGQNLEKKGTEMGCKMDAVETYG